MTPRLVFSIAIGAIVAIVALTVLGGSRYTVDEGYRGVITRNGAVVGVAEPGLGFKLPLVDSVTDMSVQTKRAVWENYVAYSRDIQQSTSYITVTYRIDPSAVSKIYSELGVNYAEKILYPLITQKGKEIYGKYSAVEIVGQRDKFGADLHAAIVAGNTTPWLVIESVQVENIDFSDAYEKAVEATAQAEADVRRAKQELEKIKVDAQQKVAQAQAEADAVRLAADAEAYRTKAQGEAEAQAIKARALALQENPALVELMAVEKWSGQLPTSMVPEGALPFLNVQ